MVKASSKRALLVFVAILTVFLFLADLLVVGTQRQYLLADYEKHSSHEIELLGTSIKESLIRNDYANVERFIYQWGIDYHEVIEISVLTGNGFVLASYKRADNSKGHHLPLEQVFSYGGDNTFTIKLDKDSTQIYKSITQLSNQLILSSILFVLFFGTLMWKTFTTIAIRPLEAEILQRKKVENDLKYARDQALAASRHKSEFLANMSHELRTPLNSIIGFTSIVKDGLAGDVNEEQQHQLDMVYTSARHLLGLINSVLDLAKVEAGKYEINKSSFNLQSFLEELRATLKPLADEKSLDFEIQIDCISDNIHTDRNMLSQILINLLSNAIKFTDQGSISLNCLEKNGELLIKVIDTGIGISEDFIDEVFDAFKQEDSSVTRKYEGTGLGLSISQHFSLMLGGYLEVESKEGKGSTFTLMIPVTKD